MDSITETLKNYYTRTFMDFGATAKGVDWNDETELRVRYDKMLAVLQKDFVSDFPSPPSMLDVGCGWGGLLEHIQSLNMAIDYTGIDVVSEMIDAGGIAFPDGCFKHGDIFDVKENESYDFVVCNAILTQKLGVSVPEMERFTKRIAVKMFELCRHGIAFNLMSTRVNYMVDNLYYQNPVELLSWLLTELSPRVRLDHGYSSLNSGVGKFYDYTVYVYKD